MLSFLRNKESSKPARLVEGVSESLSHEKTIKSMVNLAAVVVNHLSQEVFTPLQSIPHPLLRSEPSYLYSGANNTEFIKNVFEEESTSSDPFFVFSNYMETHRPYVPPEDLQRKYLGEVLSWEEVVRLNEEVAAPWKFVKLVEDGNVNEDDLRKLRGLYASEVEAVDRQLGELVDALESTGSLEETLIVVTSDHGEALGETDPLGRRRFGHEASMSEHITRVPLVVSHPDIGRKHVEEYASLKDIYRLLLDSGAGGGIDIETVLSDSVLCEYPALGDEKMYDKHPEIPRELLCDRVSRDETSAHKQGWRTIGTSENIMKAEKNGEEVDMEDAPSDLVDMVRRSLDELGMIQNHDVSDETADRLENLGYM